ncbi:hypothetical protein THAOC_33430 [Thalassiosira oceanica]|uniref:Uncharacterized protein n=1 Tax=Thalassiosira oceanica TaxID=159749 RepID=K0R464_THAOC|nr:hypothetical protein THAOC_33430 [Thalassiosira oceanica]|eukprot:EJK47823.1 hypothetical protein THAOC_33430 [Thalassiosira oceanica]
MDLWDAASIRPTSFLPRIAKSNLGLDVTLSPSSSSRRADVETSAGSVLKNQVGRVLGHAIYAPSSSLRRADVETSAGWYPLRIEEIK